MQELLAAQRDSFMAALPEPLALRNRQGRVNALRVLELAPASVVLGSTDGRSPPEYFDLWLSLPGADSMPLHGRLIRRVSGTRAAYQLKLQHQEHGERIRQFIFEQYRQRHPQLQIAG